MKRREFITLIGGAAAASSNLWPLPARAQERMPVIGVLSPLSPSQVTSPPFEAFQGALRDIGYVEGKSINVIYRWADGSKERLAEFAAELARLKVNVIFAVPGTPVAIEAQKATATIPIVFAGVGDAVGSGLVASLARPGANATGLINESQDIAGKQLEFLREGIPGLLRAGVLWRPSNPSYRGSRHQLSRFDTVVRATGVQIELIAAENREDLVTAFETIKKNKIDGLVVQADDLFINESARIIELAAANRVPAIYRLGYQAAAGGLMAYGPNIPEMYRRAASYVHKILKGAKPSDLPVEQPTKIELIVNLKTAKTLGLTVAPALLARADEVIE